MRRLLVVALVVLGLLVVADRVAARVAGRAVADQVRSAEGLSRTPSVTITGWPFLTQALRGRYDAVQVHATDVPAKGVRVSAVDARLRDVRVPLSDALGGRVTTVPVSALTARARVSYADLSAASGSRGLTFAAAPNGAVRVTGGADVLGQRVSASAASTLALDGDTLVATARSVQVGGLQAPVGGALAGLLDLRVPLGTLPYGLHATGVTAQPDGVVLLARSGAAVLRRH